MTDRPLRPQPDLDEVFSRAQRIDPNAVDQSWLEEDDEFSDDEAAIAADALRSPESLAPDPQLEDFLDSVRQRLDGLAEARSLRDIPAPPSAGAPRSAFWLGMAAAAVLTVGTVGWWISGAGGGQQDAVGSMAEHVAPTPTVSQGRELGAHETASPAESGEGEGDAEIAPDAGESNVDVVADGTTDVGGANEASANEASANDPEEAGAESERADTAPKAARPSVSDLDSAAQAAWAAGDLAEAERLFEAITKRAPKSRFAELAYGDLFSLAELRGDRGQLQSLWKRYLKQFPSGRYADDTRARLCRRDGDAERCWRDYLRRHPDGAHVEEARAKSGATSTP